MSTWPEPKRIWDWRVTSIVKVACEGRCARLISVSIEKLKSHDDIFGATMRAFVGLGWTHYQGGW
jgi:hypothetical protein